MAISLSLGDIQKSGSSPQPAPTAQPEGEPTSSGGDLTSIIREAATVLKEINNGMQEYAKLQGNMGMMQGSESQQQQGTNIASRPDESDQSEQSNTNNNSIVENIPPQQVFQFVMQGIAKLQDELGSDATLQETEEWMMENQQQLHMLIQQGKKLLVNQYGNNESSR